MTNKKIMLGMLAGLLAFGLVLSGCGGDDDNNGNSGSGGDGGGGGSVTNSFVGTWTGTLGTVEFKDNMDFHHNNKATISGKVGTYTVNGSEATITYDTTYVSLKVAPGEKATISNGTLTMGHFTFTKQ